MHYFKLAEADENEGSGGAADNQNADNTSQQQIELLTKSVGLIAEGLSKMEGNQNMILETLARVTDQSKAEVKHEIKEEFGADVDLEQLDRRQFATFIVRQAEAAFKEEIKNMLGTVDSKVQDLATRFESKNASEQITKVSDNNPDFWEWSSEIKQLLSENPTLTVNRAYALAKSENPKKAEELHKKFAKPEPKKQQSFFGLTPTSSISTRSNAGKMSQKEAAEAAFDKVMGELGDRIENGDFKLA